MFIRSGPGISREDATAPWGMRTPAAGGILPLVCAGTRSKWAARMQATLLAVLLAHLPALVAAAETGLSEYGIDELIELDVSLAARRPQRLQDAAAAITVLTSEQIRRSGARSIPELLRAVPGIDVADLGNGNWAVSVRGFNGRFSNKLQVLLDGRSLYSPLFSGVSWAGVDYLLADVERIEVIRGAGAVMWGANAMNGVINIVTRRARDTQGGLVDAAAFTPRAGAVAVRAGRELGDDIAWRAYAKSEVLGAAPAQVDGQRAGSGRRHSVGTRVDGGDLERRWTFDAQALSVDQNERWQVPAFAAPWAATLAVGDRNRQGYLQFRHEWGPRLAPDLVLRVAAESSRLEYGAVVSETRTTADADLQWRLRALPGHELLLGASYRTSRDTIGGSPLIAFTPGRQTQQVTSVFVHDEIALGRFGHVDAGVRLEHNTYNGLLPQGGLRWVLALAPQHTVWASAAHAVRTPSRAELGARIDTYLYPPGTAFPGPLPMLASIRPHPSFDLPAETLDELDVGWRASAAGKGWLDLALFAGRYRDLVMSRTGTPGLAASPPHWVVPVLSDLRGSGRTAGAEVAAEWEFAPGLRVNGRYALLELRVTRPGNLAGDALAATYDDFSPRHQYGIGVAWDPAPRWKVDLTLRGVGGLAVGPMRGYTAADVRVAWRPLRGLEMELVGRNLGAGAHVEMQSAYLPALPVEIAAAVGLGLRWSH